MRSMGESILNTGPLGGSITPGTEFSRMTRRKADHRGAEANNSGTFSGQDPRQSPRASPKINEVRISPFEAGLLISRPIFPRTK